jgi:quercetin dioxygenase-like cupin family protein
MVKQGVYRNLSEDEIKRRVTDAGFDPLRVSDPPGYVYTPHSHEETKLLAFLHGGMRVTVAGVLYECTAGDELIIPGNVEHSAVIGAEGCVYFWSEKVM